jgi:hypothetical protein
MTASLPASVIGTTRIAAAERHAFGDFLDKASGGFRGTLLTDGGSWLWDTLKVGDRRARFDIWAIVPNVAGYVREVTDYGMFGAGLRRVRRINPMSGGRLFLKGIGNAGGILKRDFPTLLSLLLELESANFRKARPKIVFLHAQMTDLLLAMDHRPALEQAIRQMRRGFGAEAGLATHNAGTLLPRLKSCGLEVPYLLTTLHPLGYGMRPDREACERALEGYGGKLIAITDRELQMDTAAYWRTHQVASAVYDYSQPTVAEWRATQGWRSGSFGPTLQPRIESA